DKQAPSGPGHPGAGAGRSASRRDRPLSPQPPGIRARAAPQWLPGPPGRSIPFAHWGKRVVFSSLSSTFAVFWGFPEVGLLAEMAGIGQVPHLAQGSYHAHYNRPYPQAVVPETTPQPVPCISTPTGSKSSCVSAADRSDSRPTAQTGSYYL